MRWPWKRRAPAPTIPPYKIPVAKPAEPKGSGIEVKEGSLEEVGIDVESMTRTGIHKAWDRMTGKFKD